MFRLYASVIRAIQLPTTIWKVGRSPILKEVPLEHVTFSFRITPNHQKQRKSSNSLVAQKYMQKIPTSANWAQYGNSTPQKNEGNRSTN